MLFVVVKFTKLFSVSSDGKSSVTVLCNTTIIPLSPLGFDLISLRLVSLAELAYSDDGVRSLWLLYSKVMHSTNFLKYSLTSLVATFSTC